jgi:hypothetical protein
LPDDHICVPSVTVAEQSEGKTARAVRKRWTRIGGFGSIMVNGDGGGRASRTGCNGASAYGVLPPDEGDRTAVSDVFRPGESRRAARTEASGSAGLNFRNHWPASGGRGHFHSPCFPMPATSRASFPFARIRGRRHKGIQFARQTLSRVG